MDTESIVSAAASGGNRVKAGFSWVILCGVIILFGSPSSLKAEETHFQRAKVIEAFLELHTGPGRSYPVFYIAEKNETLFLMKKRTDWYKVRLLTGEEGWVHRDEVEKTLRASGIRKSWSERFYERFIGGFLSGSWSGGQFENDPALFLRLAYRLTKVLSAELTLGRSSGDLGDTDLYLAGMTLTPWKGRWFSLSAVIGGGVVKTAPAQLLVNAQSDRFETAYAGAGFSVPLLDRLFLNGNFRHYTLFINPKRNRSFQELSLGLAFAF